MSRQAAEPGLDRIDRFDHAGEIPALDHLFDETKLLVSGSRIGVPDRDCRRDKGLPNLIRAQFLQCGVGIHGLVVGIGIKERRRLVGHHLFQDRGH